MDNAFVELERIETKIQMILDQNALKRTLNETREYFNMKNIEVKKLGTEEYVGDYVVETQIRKKEPIRVIYKSESR